MTLRSYRGRHLRARPKRRGPVVVGTAAVVMVGGAGTAQAGTHTVRSGETLSSIASRYKTSITKLVKINHLSNPNLIVTGQRLRVPGSGSSMGRHTVRSGETLSSIASRHGTSITRLAKINKIDDVNMIAVGQKLKVPRKGGGAPAYRAPTGSPGKAAVGGILERQARDHGLDVSLVKAQAWLESGWNQKAVSSAGAVGIMQVMPGTARYINKVLGGGGHRPLKLRNAEDNVHLGVMYLRHMLEIMPTENKALAAYYSGPGNVKGKLNKGQRWYARTVQGIRARFR